MGRLILIFLVSFGSVGLGFFLRNGLVTVRAAFDSPIQRLSKALKLFALMVIVGGIAAVVLSRAQRIPASRAASVFVSSAMSSVGLFGGLIAFVLFGTVGYSLLQLYRLFEEFLYYSVVFPFSDQIARGNIERLRLEPKKLFERPIALVPLSGILVGLILNFSPLTSPEWIDETMNYLVPALTGILGFAIGLGLKVRTVGAHGRETLTVAAVKFVIIPTVLISVALLSGLAAVAGGLPLKIVIIASVMPTGFIASVPPVVYGFDLDTTNSAWLVATAAELLIIPLLVVLL